jgi:hypothetical protein
MTLSPLCHLLSHSSGNARDAETLLKNTIEARDVRVGSDPNQQRTSADGRLLLLRCDVIEATQQMLSSRQKLAGGESHQINHNAADQSCAFLLLVLAELEQRTSVPMADTGKRMVADGVTDHSIIHHADPLAYIGTYLSDGSLTMFIEAFRRMTLAHTLGHTEQVQRLEVSLSDRGRF